MFLIVFNELIRLVFFIIKICFEGWIYIYYVRIISERCRFSQCFVIRLQFYCLVLIVIYFLLVFLASSLFALFSFCSILLRKIPFKVLWHIDFILVSSLIQHFHILKGIVSFNYNVLYD